MRITDSLIETDLPFFPVLEGETSPKSRSRTFMTGCEIRQIRLEKKEGKAKEKRNLKIQPHTLTRESLYRVLELKYKLIS